MHSELVKLYAAHLTSGTTPKTGHALRAETARRGGAANSGGA